MWKLTFCLCCHFRRETHYQISILVYLPFATCTVLLSQCVCSSRSHRPLIFLFLRRKPQGRETLLRGEKFILRRNKNRYDSEKSLDNYRAYLTTIFFVVVVKASKKHNVFYLYISSRKILFLSPEIPCKISFDSIQIRRRR
jgi:hypothetical protein